MECLKQLHSVGKKASHILRDVFMSSPVSTCVVDDSIKEVISKNSSNKYSKFSVDDFVPSFSVNAKSIEPTLLSSVILQKSGQVGTKGSNGTTSTLDEGILLPVSSGGELNSTCTPLNFSSEERQHWMSIQVSLDYRHSLSLQLLGEIRHQKNEKFHFCRHLIGKIIGNSKVLSKGTDVEELLNENYRFSLLLVNMMMTNCQEDGISHNALNHNHLFGEGVSSIRLRSHQRFVRHYCPTRSTMTDNELGSSSCSSSSSGLFIGPLSGIHNNNHVLLHKDQDECAAIIDIYHINVNKLSTITSLLEGDDLHFLKDYSCTPSGIMKSFSKSNYDVTGILGHETDEGEQERNIPLIEEKCYHENNDILVGVIDERIILRSSYFLELAEDAACTLSSQSFVLLAMGCPF